MSERPRVAVHVVREGRSVVISMHASQGERATLELRRGAAASLAAVLRLASSDDDDDWESEAEFRGSLEVIHT